MSSPFFHKKEGEEDFRREKSTLEKLVDQIKTVVVDTFVNLIPSDDIKQMPPQFMFAFGGLLVMTLIVIFVVLFVKGYQSTSTRPVLSPLDANPSSSICNTIPMSNSGQYFASVSGVWEGQTGFLYSEAAYVLEVTNFQVDNTDQYNDFMNAIYDALNIMGQQAQNDTLGNNLLTWMTFSIFGSDSNVAQRFQLVGNPAVVFNRQEIVGAIGGVNGTCNVSSSSSFDPSNSLLKSVFSATEFSLNDLCLANGQPKSFGYLPGANLNSFAMELDLRSLVVCMSVNMGLISFELLSEVQNFNTVLPVDGVDFYAATYYSPQYPSMDPIICFTNTTYGYYVCVLRVSSYFYVLPTFHHLGNSTESPQPCDCQMMSSFNKQDPYNPCNAFRFLAGFIYYPAELSTRVLNLASKFHFNMSAVNDAAFDAAFVNSYFGQNSSNAASFNSPEYRENIFDFCLVDGQYCSLYTATMFDMYQSSWAISEYYFPLTTGACSNSISIPPAQWQNLVNNPFAPLVESYQSCTSSPVLVGFTQLGVQVGNVSALTPLCVIAILLVVAAYQRVFGVDIPKGYTKKEKDQALDALSISLLLARDRRQVSNAQRKRNMKRQQRTKQATTTNKETGDDIERSFASVTPSVDIDTDADSNKGSSATHGIERLASEQQMSLLWRLVESLEEDADYHQDMYRLRQELLVQERRMRRKHFPTGSNQEAAAAASWQRVASLTQPFRRKTNASSSTGPAQYPQSDDADNEYESDTISPLATTGTEMTHYNKSAAYITSLDTKRLLTAGTLRILNDQPTTVATGRFANESEMAVAAEMLAKRLETVALAMEQTSSQSQEQQVDVQQQYWSLLREVSSAVREMRLSGRALYLLDIETKGASGTGVSVEEKARLRSLVWPLSRLMALHGLCTTNLSVSQLGVLLGETQQSGSQQAGQKYVWVWAYRMRDEVVVTLGELLKLREKLAEDSDDDENDEGA